MVQPVITDERNWFKKVEDEFVRISDTKKLCDLITLESYHYNMVSNLRILKRVVDGIKNILTDNKNFTNVDLITSVNKTFVEYNQKINDNYLLFQQMLTNLKLNLSIEMKDITDLLLAYDLEILFKKLDILYQLQLTPGSNEEIISQLVIIGHAQEEILTMLYVKI